MSLNANQLLETSRELQINLEISGLSLAELEAVLGIKQTELEAIIEMTDIVSPTNVWRVRDYLEKVILEQGKQPHPYSALKQNIYFPYD
ncbi:DUF2316 family protein [Culicoidibacter larvae]|uniref:DUF2316 family protein n=1 Tax=Culicoidibacter larvae TaxID=2579976 RepID=A0A5R8Q899_9FIRM|nr:DUF2316 family protein [Culicoidibacter larvae]TLG71807.1 DUF2316 family protein [Culicoidibacter larvae]